ncbi:hypothetical protein [Thalassovita sp.]|uniref:hypothetical protein n=1 Tax=Thalassovita sp. TaxID=1979401 RepID=UPI002B274C64|nr:hypothetical protein [Thalassovita sp.]
MSRKNQLTAPIKKLSQLTALPRFLNPATLIQRQQALKTKSRPAPAPRIDALDIPVRDTSIEQSERSALEARGQFLARQDRWEDLGREIRDYDQARAVTAGGMSKADLIANGARLDVVAPIRTALSDPGLMRQHAPRHGLRDFEQVLEDHPDDYGVALVVINAYIDAAWAWRGEGWSRDIAPDHWREFSLKMTRAGEILDRYSPFECDSPALAATRCALLAAQQSAGQRIADDYEDLIELDPANSRHMRAFGNHLLPRWFGSYQQLEIGARRAAAMTQDIWGMGGYAWTYLDALTVDPNAITLLDADFFVEAMQDILRRRPDQHTANTFAAFCAVTLRQDRFQTPDRSSAAKTLSDAFDWILRDHLREVHPLIWAMAKQGPEQNCDAPETIARDGETRALRRIAGHFDAEIRRGGRIVFDERGPRVIAPR